MGVNEVLINSWLLGLDYKLLIVPCVGSMDFKINSILHHNELFKRTVKYAVLGYLVQM